MLSLVYPNKSQQMQKRFCLRSHQGAHNTRYYISFPGTYDSFLRRSKADLGTSYTNCLVINSE